MIVYAESNVVLELALLQEQHAACEALLELCGNGRIRQTITQRPQRELQGTEKHFCRSRSVLCVSV